jgi:DNA-binding transcriptional regulator GbsR (MarR family)
LYTLDNISSILNNNPDITNIEFAEQIINIIEIEHKIWGEYQDAPYQAISAIRTDKITELADYLDQIATFLINNKDELHQKYSDIYTFMRNFDFNVDIYDFADELQKIVASNTDVYDLLENIKKCIDDAIISKYVYSCSDAYGIAIYLPKYKENYHSGYHNADYGFGLDFTQDTSWDEFLLSYVQEKGRSKFPKEPNLFLGRLFNVFKQLQILINLK